MTWDAGNKPIATGGRPSRCPQSDEDRPEVTMYRGTKVQMYLCTHVPLKEPQYIGTEVTGKTGLLPAFPCYLSPSWYRGTEVQMYLYTIGPIGP